MTAIIILVIIATGGGLFYLVRGVRAGNGVSVSTRLGRYGMAGATPGGDVSQIISPAARQQSEQSAVSKSVERIVERGRYGKSIGQRLERADVKVTPGEWVTVCFAVFVIGMLVGILVHGFLGLLVLGLAALVGPWFYLKRRTKKRRDKFLEQLADLAQMMGNSMRAGFSIIQSMELVATEGPKPGAEEFERVVTEVKLGLSIEQALDHLQQRMPSEDLELAVIAINVQRQVGGNLAEILLVIAKTVRERVRFKRDLRALTAQARYSSYIITALPVGVAIVINFMDQSYERYLYTTLIGEIMIGCAVVMLALGFFFLNRIADIEV